SQAIGRTPFRASTEHTIRLGPDRESDQAAHRTSKRDASPFANADMLYKTSANPPVRDNSPQAPRLATTSQRRRYPEARVQPITPCEKPVPQDLLAAPLDSKFAPPQRSRAAAANPRVQPPTRMRLQAQRPG